MSEQSAPARFALLSLSAAALMVGANMAQAQPAKPPAKKSAAVHDTTKPAAAMHDAMKPAAPAAAKHDSTKLHTTPAKAAKTPPAKPAAMKPPTH